MFIKFIIPCYNIGKTIGRMLNSILCQTFDDYHIVCVEDCSPDNTLAVLEEYRRKNPNRITILKNPHNFGAGASRNKGYYDTLESIPSDFIWMVDGDDRIATQTVLQNLYQFYLNHPNVQLIPLGCTYWGKIRQSTFKFPHGLWSTVFRTDQYIPAISKNINTGNDIYTHFLLYDTIEKARIIPFKSNCYVWSGAGNHKAKSTLNWKSEVGKAILEHHFKKEEIRRYICETYDWANFQTPEQKQRNIRGFQFG